jgi:PAS domain S-box-containing protein
VSRARHTALQERASHEDGHQATAADLVRHFGHWRDATRKGPVYVTHHGRPTHVLLDYNQFATLLERHRPEARGPVDGDPAKLPIEEVIDWLNVGFIACDAQLTIRAINRISCGRIGRQVNQLVGEELCAAVPQLADSLQQNYIARTLRSGEACSADLPSVLHPERWIRFDVFPLGSGIGIVSRDITEDVRHNRLANVKEAILESMRHHGRIGYMRVDSMGSIEQIDRPLCSLLGLAEERLVGLSALEIVPLRLRMEFRETLAGVLKQGGSVQLASAVLRHGGELVPIDMVMTALKGTYGTEGCVILFTSRDWPQ